MRIAVVVSGGVPNPAQNGSTLTVWTVIRHLLVAGHEVETVVVGANEADDPGARLEDRVERLRALGAGVHLVGSRAGLVFERMTRTPLSRVRRSWRPADEELLPNLLDAEPVRELCEELRPDVAYVYHWEAVAATRALRGLVPRLATVVDLPQLSAWYRWRIEPGRLSRRGLSRLIWLQARIRRLPRLLVDLLNECEGSANFAAHHAAWLRERGATRCEYLRTPLEDRVGERWRAARRSVGRDRTRLLLIGHLRGVSTLDGLELFAEEVLPRLEAELGADGLEIRLAGGFQPPPGIAQALARPSIRLLGHLEEPDGEFAAADALVVPTSIPLGTRVRILTAFSFGCPVVAHRANALGIPELADGENVLLAETGDEIADGVLRLVRDAALQARLEEAGRRTYERFFAQPVAGAALAERLQRIAAGVGAPRAPVPS